MNLIKAMATVAGMTVLSRVAGFARDVLTAAYLGAGPVADAFFVALKLPNFFRRVTAEGAFSISFVPIYAKKMMNEDQKNADFFASNAFMVMVLWLSIITVFAVIFMPYMLELVAPGFGSDPIRRDLAVEFSRITFPYLLLMSLGALLGGVLNAHNRFAPFAFAPVLFNLCLIISIFMSSFFETVGHAMSYGLIVSGVLQLIFLWGCAKRAGIKITFKKPKLDDDAKQVLRLMGPAMIGAGVIHINLFADMIIASFMGEGAISYLYYADRLNQLPLGTVGIAVGTALLPMLSRAMAKDDPSESIDLFNRSLEYCLLLALPAAIALCVIPNILITVLFERGEFTSADTIVTAKALFCYALGLPAYIATKIFSTAHWARQDTITPVKISVAATILNIVLAVIFIQFNSIGVAGIALGTGIVGWLQYGAHIYCLRDHSHAQFDDKFRKNYPRIIFASILMGIVIYVASLFGGHYIYEHKGILRIIALGAFVSLGCGVYAIAILYSGVVKISDIKKVFLRKLKK